jgi:acyl-CoA synthetase
MTSGSRSTVSQLVRERAARDPDGVAFVDAGDGTIMTWAGYDALADRVAARYAQQVAVGDRVAIQMAHRGRVHAAYVGFERLGAIVVGIGERASERETEHLVAATGATMLLHDVEEQDHTGFATASRPEPDDTALWFLNSTSGTTGLPKCVMHDQARWFAFHDLAQRAARFTPDDVFASLLPAPFGFGMWTAHFTPAIAGRPCVVLDRFTPEAAIAAIEHHRVSVLAAVSTQFIMMLESAALEDHDLTSLRVMFTGGEMVPYERALDWERRTGCTVLQFYGSNETGALSGTTLDDPPAIRLRTAGRVLPEMHVRLLDADTDADITATGGPGVAACRGPVTCLGYYDDPEANAALVTRDGWMKTGDLCTIDADGVLTVAGRVSDFIIRGGKNLSAAVVEQEVATMPGVLLAAAVAKPDPVYGERVCVFCATEAGTAFSLGDLRAHLAGRGVGKEHWPEFLVLLDGDLPRSSGGKVAKAELRARAAALR